MINIVATIRNRVSEFEKNKQTNKQTNKRNIQGVKRKWKQEEGYLKPLPK